MTYLSGRNSHGQAEAGDESGYEAVAANAFSQRKRQDGHRQCGQSLKRFLHPVAIRHALDQRSTDPANGQPYNRAENYLLQYKAEPRALVIARFRTK